MLPNDVSHAVPSDFLLMTSKFCHKNIGLITFVVTSSITVA